MSSTETRTPEQRPTIHPGDIDRLPWRALVIYTDEMRLGHEKIPADAPAHRLTPPASPTELLADAGRLLEYVARLFRGEGTVLVNRAPGEWANHTPFAYTERELQMMVDDAADAGWQTDLDKGRRSGWFHFRHASPVRADVFLGILPMMDMREFPFQLIPAGYASDLRGYSAAHLAHQLAQYHAAIGAAWRFNAGSSGVAAIRNRYRGGQYKREEPLWQLTRAAQDWHTTGGELRWHRPLTPSDLEYRYVHTYDMRAARLNAMGMVSCLPWGSLDYIDHPVFDPNRGGYWRVPVCEYTDSVFPRHHTPPAFDHADADAEGCVKLTTPLLAYLVRRYGYEPTVVDGQLAERSGRYLRGIYDKWRDALLMGDAPDVQDAVKLTYQRTPSMMLHGGLITRHDWNDHILDYERVTVLEGADRVRLAYGIEPLRIVVDELFYPSDSADPAGLPFGANTIPPGTGYGALLGDGPQLGKFKWRRTFTMAEYLAKYGAE